MLETDAEPVEGLARSGPARHRASGARRRDDHERASFAAQHAAEKAVKALHLHFGQEARGHVIARLLPPFEHYGPLQSEEAIRYAGEILRFARDQMA